LKKKVFTRYQLTSDAQQVFDVLGKETDLACVVIGAAYLDSLLASLLNTKFRTNTTISNKLLEPNKGALGNYQSRADLTYCLSLIEKEQYNDLCKIGEIRNLFAHNHLYLNFSEVEVQNKCAELKAWKALPTDGALRMIARNQFIISVAILSQMLLLHTIDVEHDKHKGNMV
jgi:DNA-binding MltR family transcriptional regulator